MNIGELFVELVLAGLLTMAALLFPAYSLGLLGTFALSAETLAVAIALGYAVGVIVDRSADTILDRWLGIVRLEFAKKVEKQRTALVASRSVQDVFPEDWLKIQIFSKGGDGAVRTMEALRTRIRVARNMVVLTPMLTVSAIIGDWPPSIAGTQTTTAEEKTVLLFPLIELVALIAAVMAARRLKAPHTSTSDAAVPSRLASAVTAWFGLHVLAAGVAILSSADRTTAVCIAATGFLLTVLAAFAWERMSESYFAFLWNHSRFTDPEKLAAHMSSGSTSTQGAIGFF